MVCVVQQVMLVILQQKYCVSSLHKYYTAKLGDSFDDEDDSSRNSDLNFINSRPR